MLRFFAFGALAFAVLGGLVGCGSKDGAPAASVPGPALGSPDGKTAAKPAPVDERLVRFPKVQLETNLGAITLELDATKAPLTVENFLSYVDSGFYDQTVFHQVIKDYAVVGGSFDPKMNEKKPQLPIRNEAHNGLKNQKGTIGMARAPNLIDSVTSQFYINLGDNTSLDHKNQTVEGYGYCVFGKVVAGQDVLNKIAGVTVSDREGFEKIPVDAVTIKSARRAK
jgi:cyclophilin family peptidyl-prolyl cis-trans isomerase